MYSAYYGFKEKPFNVTSDPAFLYLSRKHKEAIASMSYGIQQRKGIIVLTGEIGTGKTTLCRTLLGQLDKSVKTALVLNPCFSEIQLLEFIIQDFGIQAKKKNRLSLINELNKFLIEESLAGNNAAIIIDEAQNLTARQLEQIRLLSNLETSKEKLLQIILTGQPELREKLKSHQLRQLRQRVMVDYHIEPLDRSEIKEYVRHRLDIASGRSLPGIRGEQFNIDAQERKAPEFSEDAISEIFQFSNGTPRLLNLLCDRALLLGFIKETRAICANIIRECVKDIKTDEHNLRGIKENAGKP
ncbi:AAA family ATPase [bacterium]|nr:MAG: AAA family ATPase [bacterium]